MEGWVDFLLLDADYVLEGGEPVVRLWGKTREGKSIAVLDRTFSPYFYVEPEGGMAHGEINEIRGRICDLEMEGEKIRKAEDTERKFLGKPVRVIKIMAVKPSSVPQFRSLLENWVGIREEYEHSIPFYKRYMIDRGLVPMKWAIAEGRTVENAMGADVVFEAKDVKSLEADGSADMRILAFDIEVVQKDGKESIIMASFAGNAGFRKVLTYGVHDGIENVEILENEKELMGRFIQVVRENDPDILLGYNTDRFDFVKLFSKGLEHRLPLALGRDGREIEFRKKTGFSATFITGRVHVDLFNFVSTIIADSLSTESLTLNNVAMEVIGEGKERIEWKDLEKDWLGGEISRLAAYCLRDSVLTLKLGMRLLPQLAELCKITGQTPFDTSRMTYSQLVEWLLIREAFGAGELVPNRPRYDEVMRRRTAPPYAGGYVKTPKQGMHENIALFDFASLYPSITVTHNISPETLDCQCCQGASENRVPEQDHYYCSRRKGFIPAILEGLVKKRDEIKEEMRKTGRKSEKYRDLDNRQSALKILSNSIYGYYGYPGSRWYSRVCAESITAWGRHYIKAVIGLAEESGYEVIYGDTDSLFLKMNDLLEAEEFLGKTNKSLPGMIELDLDNFYLAGIFVPTREGRAAKKRYALMDTEGVIVIRGLEKVRRDWSNIAKETQERILHAILKERSPEMAIRIARGEIERLQGGSVSLGDLVIYSQLTKPIHAYSQIGPHVAAAKKAMGRGKAIATGSIIGYIITKGPGSISERAELFEDAVNYDPDYYINNQLLPAAMRVLAGLGISEEDITSDEKQSSLKGFLGKDDAPGDA
ncbi:MAG: hypothetical protein HY367_00595 [Candidatus Aenigmarchaeota archaeon]|nr:hypothetical protein [Candidatus Aenigmarchaeota archaeon]